MLGKKTLFKIIYQSIALKKVLDVYYVKIKRVTFFFRGRKYKTRALVKTADDITEH